MFLPEHTSAFCFKLKNLMKSLQIFLINPSKGGITGAKVRFPSVSRFDKEMLCQGLTNHCTRLSTWYVKN